MNFPAIISSKIAITIDIDWASEAAIEYTLDYFERKRIPVTVFTTHDSSILKDRIDNLEIGLHPYFHENSSHGFTVDKTVETVLNLPHNLKAYRCHRFLVSNEIQEVMKNAGMVCSSNVCTNLAIIKPFFNRFNTLEIPIFLEDGAYLFNGHNLECSETLKYILVAGGLKTIVVHPMHFVINTPNWEYMVQIKERVKRKEWNSMGKEELFKLRNVGKGIATFLENLFDQSMDSESEFTTIGRVMSMEMNTGKAKAIPYHIKPPL